MNAVLLNGYLTEKVLEEALQELRDVARLGGGACNLVINSPGGEILAALKFVKKARALPLVYEAKLYHAQSAAAFVAFALSCITEVKRDTVLGFHRGCLTLEVPDLSKEGQVPRAMVETLREYGRQLDEVIDRLGISDSKLLGTFHGGGWLRLSAKECLERKVVQRIF